MADRPQEVKLNFRPLEERDVAILYAWNQNAEVTRYMPSMPKGLTYEAHLKWAGKAVHHRERMDYMIEEGLGWIRRPRPIGRVHAASLGEQSPEVGVLIGDLSMWGKGIATLAIAYIVSYLRDRGRWASCHALIHPENLASISAFEKNAFVRRTAGDGQLALGRGNQLIFDKVIRL